MIFIIEGIATDNDLMSDACGKTPEYGLTIEGLKFYPSQFVITDQAGIMASLNEFTALDRETFKQGLREVVA